MMNENILGLVGQEHLSGMVMFSKPALLAGFENQSNKENVGVHEFAHLVDKGRDRIWSSAGGSLGVVKYGYNT